jgi:hypothetical protein
MGEAGSGRQARAFVVAHYDADGRIARHLVELLRAFTALSDRVLLVSTGATPAVLAALPQGVRAITRPNVGYDFTSYRTGIEAIGRDPGLRQIVLLNDSFVCIDPARLCRRMLEAPAVEADLVGMTSSGEGSYHVQSHFFCFQGSKVLESEAFAAWWSSMQPLSDREEVIRRYELGMTPHFAAAGFRVAAAFAPTTEQHFRAVCRWFEVPGRAPPVSPQRQVTLDLTRADTLNPLHFLWDDILDEFGVVKLELLKANPFGVNLHRFAVLQRRNARIRQLVADALQRPRGEVPAGTPDSA